MNRIFHARITVGQYLFLLLATAMTIHELWMKHAIIAIFLMLLLVIAIERLIHTTYTLTTDDKLILSFGRFSRPKEIPLKEIFSVERASSMKIGRFAVMRYVVVKYGTKGKCAVLLPVKEELFIEMLEKRVHHRGEEDTEGVK